MLPFFIWFYIACITIMIHQGVFPVSVLDDVLWLSSRSRRAAARRCLTSGMWTRDGANVGIHQGNKTMPHWGKPQLRLSFVVDAALLCQKDLSMNDPWKTNLVFLQPKLERLLSLYRVSSKTVCTSSLFVNYASHASLIIKWSIYFFSWIKIDAKNGITLKNWF